MKLSEILDLSPYSDFLGKPVKLLNIYDKKNRNIGLTSKVSAQTVVVKNTNTKQIVGKRSIFLKDPNSSKVALPVNDPRYSSV